MNAVLMKNTIRRLAFDVNSGLIPIVPPHVGYFGGGMLPTEGFEIYAYIQVAKKDGYNSFGGYASFDQSGAGVLDGLYWKQIYDIGDISGETLEDYTLQIGHMLHELAHIFGAGYGEYYNFAVVNDWTGVTPNLSSKLALYPDDPYWNHNKKEYLADPLLGGANIFRFVLPLGEFRLRAEVIGVIRYSALTAAVMNGPYRGRELETLPDLSRIGVRILNEQRRPISSAMVWIWNVDKAHGSESTLEWKTISDRRGMAYFPWLGGNPFNNITGMKMIKIFRSNLEPTGRLISVFDLQEAKLLRGEDHALFVLPVTLVPTRQIWNPSQDVSVKRH